MGSEVVRAQSHSGLQHDARHHEFTPLGIRYSEDSRFANSWMSVENCFDFAGINIFATCDNHVFQAVKDVEIAVRILIADVSRAKHSVSKCESRVLRIVPVAPHDVGAPCDQFPVLPDFHFLSPLVLDSLLKSYGFASGICVSRFSIVGTSTVWVTRSRWTNSQKPCGLNFGIVTWRAPKAGAANMAGKSAM